ncbi:MAG: vancomycin high temperature exclusion protein [Flavobacteriales bacterium]
MYFFTSVKLKLFSHKVAFRLVLISGIAFLLFVSFSLISYHWVKSSTKKQHYSSLAETPSNDVALLLGTAEKTRRGYINPYFSTRMKAAAGLYHTGKVKHILVSGDNKTRNYNEPIAMQKHLIKLGVPKSAITLDYAGFRTFDSMVRAKEVFGQSKFTIVSQQFHNERALFICNALGIEAIAYNASAVTASRSMMYIRELFARSKAVLDVYVLQTKPKFLGKREEILLN